ncbi:D(1B) dopamine receptor [Lonchura striata]|uniref:D(1B) dopamine receptor n=2 Tax=Estrildinae TaxID=40155 RepID=A0A218VCM8_9PASE|nr:D(1B) dopamine receptor [Lonchura striata domestica]
MLRGGRSPLPPATGPPSEARAPAGAPGAAQVAAGSLLALLILWTLFGNVLVCAAIVRYRHLRSKVTNIFIVSLAVSDLLVALLVMPWKAVAEVAGYWPFGAFCNVWVAFDIMCSTASILNLCVISVDRYWAISSPFRYERKMTQRLALVMISVAWALSVLISFIPVQLNWHKGGDVVAADDIGDGFETAWAAAGAVTTWAEDMSTTWVALAAVRPSDGTSGSNDTLSGPSESCDSSLNRTYAISSSLISFYIPVAIMIVTYTRIYRIAQVQIRRISSLERAAEHAQSCRSSHIDCHHHTSLKSSIRKETKVLKTLSVIMGVFVCCWLPFFILNCMVPFCESPPSDPHAGLPCVSETTFNVFVWFGWANSSLNPIIYAFNADFRKVFSNLLGCGQFCSGTAVETVNISNELISYNQDTLYHKEIVTAYVNMIPNVVDCEENREDPFDRMSQISPDHEVATDSACELDYRDSEVDEQHGMASRCLCLGSTVREHKEYYYFLDHLTEMTVIPLVALLSPDPCGICRKMCAWKLSSQEERRSACHGPGAEAAVAQGPTSSFSVGLCEEHSVQWVQRRFVTCRIELHLLMNPELNHTGGGLEVGVKMVTEKTKPSTAARLREKEWICDLLPAVTVQELGQAQPARRRTDRRLAELCRAENNFEFQSDHLFSTTHILSANVTYSVWTPALQVSTLDDKADPI